MELKGINLTNSRLVISKDRDRRRENSRNKVLVTILYARKSGLGNGSVVGRLVVFDNRNHLVGSTVLAGQEELDAIGWLDGESLEGKDSLGFSISQLNATGGNDAAYRWMTMNFAFRRILLSLLI
jgi:hypothetical protein